MPTTIQNILDLARIPLNDDAATRYTETKAIKYANEAIAAAYRIRPDLKFGSYGTPFTDLVAVDQFPLPIEFRQAAADYISGRLSLMDEEATANERAAAFMQIFERQLTL